MLKFTKEHEWIRVENDVGTVGITDYAQTQLGDVVFVELPQSGKALEQGKEAAVVESVKAASEIYAPASGTVTEVNAALGEQPGKVNEDAGGAGWFFKLKLAKPAELDGLMDEAGYKSYIEGLH
jgi:glycine cleavage system H protein